jgi:hypothetical protein
MTLAGIMVFSISAYAAQGNAPASKKDELPQMNMTMCDGKMGADCPMTKAASAQAAPGQCNMMPNCPMGNAAPAQAGAGKCQMADNKCAMHCMMRSMIDVMKMQEKIIAGVPSATKKKMTAAIDKKIAEMDGMIDCMQKMPMPCNQPGAPAAPQAPAK